MGYKNITAFERAAAAIVPTPKLVNAVASEGLLIDKSTGWTLTAPGTTFGPAAEAEKRLRRLLTELYGEERADGIQVTMTIETADFQMRCPEEGYRVTLGANSVHIAGFGEKGLLHSAVTLEQVLKAPVGETVPAMEITDWPDNPIRGLTEECRYGSNIMERDEWMALLDDLVSKKMNTLGISLYGCWSVQYDGEISEYLYMPIKSHPELKTPQRIKYWSPEKQCWIQEEKLPPIFCDNLLEDIFRRAQELGIQIIPCINSFGHNTFLPRLVPEVSPVNEDGVRQDCGFCTSSQATYDLLFSIFDQLMDDYMLPYGMNIVNLGLDEVGSNIGRHRDDIYTRRDPWCMCPACRGKEKGDRFIEHIIKLMVYLKEKGAKGVMMYGDMLQENRVSKLGWLGDRLMDAMRAEHVEDLMVVNWWSYHDIEEKNWIKSLYPNLGLRGIVAPWNGYHTWSITLQPLGNAHILSQVNKRDGGEGMIAYSMWDRACDRTHDAVAEYGWGCDQAGTPKDVTRRYALRHFGPRAHEAYRAYRLMDYTMEQRFTKKWSYPDKEAISNMDLLTYRLTPYNFGYVLADKPYPRPFMDEALNWTLTMRPEVERALYSISSMAREARATFTELAADPACDRIMAQRQAYECENYQNLSEDWLAILEMYDLSLEGDWQTVAEIARERRQIRMEQLVHCEQYKERFLAQSMAMRQICIFIHLFEDIADYIDSDRQPELNLLDLNGVLSQRSIWLR